jgi:hypothetical protein
MINGLIRVSLETVRADDRRRLGTLHANCVFQGLACTLTAAVEIFLFFCFPATGLHFTPSFMLGKGARGCMWAVCEAVLTVSNSVFEHAHGIPELARRSPSRPRARA